MNAASAAKRGIVESNHQDFVHLGRRSDRSLFTHCCGEVCHIRRKLKGEPATIPFVKGPLLEFCGNRSLNLSVPFSNTHKASSIMAMAASISSEEMINGGMIRITGSK